MLVKNEADRLVKSLPSLDFFEEIVIYDSGSEDGSQAICENYGARVIHADWEGFAATRIRMFKDAQQPWIFWIDADEVVTEALAQELKTLFFKNPSKDAYALNRMVYFEGQWIRHGDWFPDWNVRLFRNDVWSMEPRAVHESLDINGSVGRLEGLLEHHTYRNREDQHLRSERYAKLWAQQHAGKKTATVLTPYTRAAWRFFKGYILKGGFRDGRLGLHIARSNAFEVFLKYQLLREQS